MLVKSDHFPNFTGENKKYWKPPSSHIEAHVGIIPPFKGNPCNGYIDPNNWKPLPTRKNISNKTHVFFFNQNSPKVQVSSGQWGSYPPSWTWVTLPAASSNKASPRKMNELSPVKRDPSFFLKEMNHLRNHQFSGDILVLRGKRSIRVSNWFQGIIATQRKHMMSNRIGVRHLRFMYLEKGWFLNRRVVTPKF